MKKTLCKIFVVLAVIFSIGIISYIYLGKDNILAEEEIITNISEEAKEEEEGKKLYFDIKGAVKKPGVYEFTMGERVIDAISKAGGLNKDANTNNINLSQSLKEEMVIYIFTNKEIKNNNAQSKCDTSCTITTIEVNNCTNDTESNSSSSSSENTSKLVNINTATLEELMSVSGIGEAKAKAIIAYREQVKFTTIEDIKNVSGIGDSLFAQIKDFITV